MKKENQYFGSRKPINFIFERPGDQPLLNEILELTIEKDTIANIPCKVNKVFNHWIQESCLEAINDVRTACWFVTTPTRRSIQELKKLYNYHNGRLKIILVKNNVVSGEGDWNLALDDETKEFIRGADIPQVEIANLKLMPSLYEQNKLLNDDYPALFELLDPEDERLTDDQKEQFSTYLRMATDAIVGTGLLSSCELEAKI